MISLIRTRICSTQIWGFVRLSVLFSHVLPIIIDGVLHNLLGTWPRVVTCRKFIQSAQILPFVAVADVPDHKIESTVLRFISFIFTLPLLVIVFLLGLCPKCRIMTDFVCRPPCRLVVA